MEWLYLLLFVGGLGLLWLIIKGVERLITIVKDRDVKIRKKREVLEKRIEQEEADFYRTREYQEIIENTSPDKEITQEEYHQAMKNLSSDELMDSMIKRMFGNKEDNIENVQADKSAFAEEPKDVVVASGKGIMPVKAKSSAKPLLSKQEQKIFNKIKQQS